MTKPMLERITESYDDYSDPEYMVTGTRLSDTKLAAVLEDLQKQIQQNHKKEAHELYENAVYEAPQEKDKEYYGQSLKDIEKYNEYEPGISSWRIVFNSAVDKCLKEFEKVRDAYNGGKYDNLPLKMDRELAKIAHMIRSLKK